ncbi:hypothetical protein RSAG8_05922, partial [Rhizoctonia solani AG-8 WAC10335]
MVASRVGDVSNLGFRILIIHCTSEVVPCSQQPVGKEPRAHLSTHLLTRRALPYQRGRHPGPNLVFSGTELSFWRDSPDRAQEVQQPLMVTLICVKPIASKFQIEIRTPMAMQRDFTMVHRHAYCDGDVSSTLV